jgi:uncharacterized protein YegL
LNEEVVVESDLLDQAEFADNPEPRCPVVLVLDTSGSMEGAPISELNQGLEAFSAALQADRLASLRVEVAIVTFGGRVRVMDPVEGRVLESPGEQSQSAFITVDSFNPPRLSAGGGTPMGTAVMQALDLLHDRKELYRQNSVDYFRPWMFLITDGRPTDADWTAAAEQVKAEEARKGVLFFGVGVQGADMAVLSEFSALRPPLKLQGLAFGQLFQWLSKSLSVIAHSRPGEQAALPPVDWGQVDTSH